MLPSESPTHPGNANKTMSSFVLRWERDIPSTTARIYGFILRQGSKRVALLAIAGLWAALFILTWAGWGDVTIDCGREMYVPSVLAQGKTLYKDIWYLYGPAAPYLNSLLFRLFGVHLYVLYWAGALSALGSAVFLFLTGARLVSIAAGFVAAVVVVLQSFVPGISCFPLPYSYAAVYGCLATSLFLWLVTRRPALGGEVGLFLPGIVAAVALVTKVEFGFGCYAALTLLMLCRAVGARSYSRLLLDIATVLPGVVLCAAVCAWVLSFGGLDFLLQNMASLPGSYFMAKYGHRWLAANGFTSSPAVLAKALIKIALAVLFWLVFGRLGPRLFSARRTLIIGALALVAGAIAAAGAGAANWAEAPLPYALRRIYGAAFFPEPSVLLAVLAIVPSLCLAYRRGGDSAPLAFPVLFALCGGTAFRCLVRLEPASYGIYCDGPVLLAVLAIMTWFARSQGARHDTSRPRPVLLLYFGLLLAAAMQIDGYRAARKYVPIETARGTIRVPPENRTAYKDAIAFMREKARAGQFTMSVPEDTSLYFLSGVNCPIGFYQFAPGMLAPGPMTDAIIRDIERKRVRYLIWSNRTFEEYGAPLFGQDFDKPLGDYFRSHFKPVAKLGASPDYWQATIWERVSNETNDAHVPTTD